MLQIITGKFFKKDVPLRTYDGKGITYSNYSWMEPIKTSVATLEPVEIYSTSVSSFVISYVNKIEKMEGPGSIVRIGDYEIVHQFELLSFFGLKSFFSNDRPTVEINCRDQPKTFGDQFLPSKFVYRFFQSNISGSMDEIQYFMTFVDKVVGLPRKEYSAFINCLENFYNALQVLNYNIDLSYSMLVFCLESLSQNFENFEPTWDDYDPKIRTKLNDYFFQIEPEVANGIQKVLVESQNLKLQKRFVDFCEKYISDSYFFKEAKGVRNATRKSQLNRALKNAYSTRSLYAHQLKPIREQLKIPYIAEADIFVWEKEPYFTFNGLVRLTHHILTNFVHIQNNLDTEEFAWKYDLPGIVEGEVAPQYWVHISENFEPAMAIKRLSGFLEILQSGIIENQPIPNLNELLEKYECLIPTSKVDNRIPMLALYYLYNYFIEEKDRITNYSRFTQKYSTDFQCCCIEMMVVSSFEDENWPWELEKCVSVYREYDKKRFSKNNLKIPLFIEIRIILKIANAYLYRKMIEEYEEWMDIAFFELAGRDDIQILINDHKLQREPINLNLIMKTVI